MGADFTAKPDCENCGGSGEFAPGEPCHFCLSDAIRAGELDGVADGVAYVGGESVRSPADHCFREDSPTDTCSLCGLMAEWHTGCDCEPSLTGSE